MSYVEIGALSTERYEDQFQLVEDSISRLLSSVQVGMTTKEVGS
jgi:hypothetical protein